MITSSAVSSPCADLYHPHVKASNLSPRESKPVGRILSVSTFSEINDRSQQQLYQSQYRRICWQCRGVGLFSDVLSARIRNMRWCLVAIADMVFGLYQWIRPSKSRSDVYQAFRPLNCLPDVFRDASFNLVPHCVKPISSHKYPESNLR